MSMLNKTHNGQSILKFMMAFLTSRRIEISDDLQFIIWSLENCTVYLFANIIRELSAFVDCITLHRL